MVTLQTVTTPSWRVLRRVFIVKQLLEKNVYKFAINYKSTTCEIANIDLRTRIAKLFACAHTQKTHKTPNKNWLRNELKWDVRPRVNGILIEVLP